jgi:hypothetical protein
MLRRIEQPGAVETAHQAMQNWGRSSASLRHRPFSADVCAELCPR